MHRTDTGMNHKEHKEAGPLAGRITVSAPRGHGGFSSLRSLWLTPSWPRADPLAEATATHGSVGSRRTGNGAGGEALGASPNRLGDGGSGLWLVGKALAALAIGCYLPRTLDNFRDH
jgi:hypothetical protein